MHAQKYCLETGWLGQKPWFLLPGTTLYSTLNMMETRRKAFCCSVELSLKGPFLLMIDMNKLDIILCTPIWRLRLSSNRKIKYYKCESR